MSDPKLLGCPFCGNPPRSATHLTYSNYGVVCDCGAIGPTFNAGYRPPLAAEVKAVNDAIEAWNTRAAPPPAADAVTDAMVEAALDACAREGDEPWRQLPEEVITMLKVDMRRAIAAALAAKGKP